MAYPYICGGPVSKPKVASAPTPRNAPGPQEKVAPAAYLPVDRRGNSGHALGAHRNKPPRSMALEQVEPHFPPAPAGAEEHGRPLHLLPNQVKHIRQQGRRFVSAGHGSPPPARGQGIADASKEVFEFLKHQPRWQSRNGSMSPRPAYFWRARQGPAPAPKPKIPFTKSNHW